MSQKKFTMNRRRLIKFGISGLFAIPLSHWLRGTSARAAQSTRVEESDALAQKLNYRHNAAQTPSEKRASDQFCRNCTFFQGGPGSEWGPCTVFGGREVNAGGWCTSYFKRA